MRLINDFLSAFKKSHLFQRPTMSKNLWTVNSYVIPASHIRGFARGVKDEQNTTDHLRLAVKQYVPKNNNNNTSPPADGDGGSSSSITLIAAQGVGQSKELYEPFFDALLLLRSPSLPIRAIWTLDSVHHGASYLLNTTIIGDQHHWLDSSRDILQLVNHFQTAMPPPIYGLGQSWGAATITMASALHPRLFTGIISIEAVLDTGHRLRSWLPKPPAPSEHGALSVLKRRDSWPSRAEARKNLSAKRAFAAFDAEVFDLSMRYDLLDAPTTSQPNRVILTTPKAMQVGTMMLPDPPLPGYPPTTTTTTTAAEAEHLKNKNESTIVVSGFHRPEVPHLQNSLPFIHPPVLYLWGKESHIGMSDYATEMVNKTGSRSEGAEGAEGRTGSGSHLRAGGGGGVSSGQVKSIYMDNVGHTIVLEKPRDAAGIVGGWIGERHRQWMEKRKERRENGEAAFMPGVVNPGWFERVERGGAAAAAKL